MLFFVDFEKRFRGFVDHGRWEWGWPTPLAGLATTRGSERGAPLPRGLTSSTGGTGVWLLGRKALLKARD